MTFKVYIIADAEQDIAELYDYIANSESMETAEYVFQNLKKKCLSLHILPNRGHYPPELERIRIFEYREIHFKQYRIIYQVNNSRIYIHCVLDGRRELQELLERRLLR
jgi:toxin ParE1/3/4